MDRRRKRQLRACALLGLGLVVLTLAIAAYWQSVADSNDTGMPASRMYMVWLPTLITLTAFVAAGVATYLVLEYVANKESPNPHLPDCKDPFCGCPSHDKYEDRAEQKYIRIPNRNGLSPETAARAYRNN